MNWNLACNVLSVSLGAMAVYWGARYPMTAIALAFLSGITVALSSRYDMTGKMLPDQQEGDTHGTQK
jgi:hypothetical protein